MRRGCWQNFFILKNKSVIRRFQRSFRSAEPSSPINGPLNPGWSWKTEKHWCPSLSHIHSFIHYLPGHLQRRQSRLTHPEDERICVFVFHCCSRIPEVTKEEKWLWAGGFSLWSAGSMASRPVGRQKYHRGRAWWEICSHCKRRGRGKRRRRESRDTLPLPFMYLLPPAFKGACLPPQPSPTFYSTIL